MLWKEHVGVMVCSHTAIHVAAGRAQSRLLRGDQLGWDVLGGSVSIEEPELVGTQSPQWPQGQAGE